MKYRYGRSKEYLAAGEYWSWGYLCATNSASGGPLQWLWGGGRGVGLGLSRRGPATELEVERDKQSA